VVVVFQALLWTRMEVPVALVVFQVLWVEGAHLVLVAWVVLLLVAWVVLLLVALVVLHQVVQELSVR